MRVSVKVMSSFQNSKLSPYRAQLAFIVLVVLIGLCRHIPISHPELYNFSPVLALFLLSGSFLRGYWAWLTPIAAVLVTDLLLNPIYGANFFEPFMLINYFCYLLVFSLGKFLHGRKNLGLLVAGSVGGSLLFHCITCFFAWLSYPPEYAHIGWLEALTYGLPGLPPSYVFLKNSMISSVLFTFAIGWIAFRLKVAAPVLDEKSPVGAS